ncbi:MAG TPA: FAD-binding oxidoreductase [Ilumatobacteraceae bacterium]
MSRWRDKLVPSALAVHGVELLTDRLLRVRLARPAHVALAPGTHIAVRSEPGSSPFGTWRRYTISAATAESVELIAYLHGDGPGTRLLRSLRVGDSLSVRASDPPLDVPPRSAPVIITDESGIGTVVALLPLVGAATRIIVHVKDAADAAPLTALTDEAPTVIATPAIERAPVLAALAARSGVPLVVVVGQRDTVRDVRRWARERSTAVVHRTYWAPGRTGLE